MRNRIISDSRFLITPHHIDADVVAAQPPTSVLRDPHGAAQVVRWMRAKGRWCGCPIQDLDELIGSASALWRCRGVHLANLGRAAMLASAKNKPELFYVTLSFVTECFFISACREGVLV